ncbi:hypothetical protein DFP72DRAFT_1164969 [Ephemerocybe angulata]|uniref:AAA+ ATPase domain-containing protein n=1 Tax=Ephemerocybe angulata TaxID=980116 RepID=A0A8H6IBL8_9AGAR|nr:hypothetical protein DFP72DRAFT_1164969 [Tulosesus angulatus]
MVERQRKTGPKKKKDGKPVEPTKQKTIKDMFAARIDKAAPSVITLESSPEILDDTLVIPTEGTSTDVAPVVDHDDYAVAINETKRTRSTSELNEAQPQPHEPQTPLNTPTSLPGDDTAIATTTSSASALVQKVEGMTPSKPIVIDSSPVKERMSKLLPKPGVVHPFFVPRGSSTKQKAPQNPQKTKSAVGWSAPYPTCVSQHVRGPQTMVPISSVQATCRPSTSRHIREEYATPSYDSLIPGLHSPYLALSDTDKVHPQVDEALPLQQYASTIPNDHLAHHPSISRLVDRSLCGTLPQSSRGRTLADKWRPRCAEEVLGNEASARYLRNWLRALELQLEESGDTPPVAERPTKKDNKAVPNRTRKRPRVITEVVRPRYRKRMKTDSDDEDDSWIVDDEEEEEEEAYCSSHYTSDFDGEPQPTPSSPFASTSSIPDTGAEVLSNLPDEPPQDLGELHNTILLVGPPGSGKTACVYACAEELGWEVFEVYPGIGKRNGTSVENLVGEVGKNHLVRQRPHGRHDFFRFSSPSKRKQGLNSKSEPDSEYDRRSFPPNSDVEVEIEDSVHDRVPSLAQSLILLEEVDILFREDGRFWEVVKQVIKDCKRPIILTCNDISLVPLADLPLQRVLRFDACASDLLTSYLQGICCAEGRSVDRMALTRCIASREGQDPTKRSGHVFDLRRAIHSLDLALMTGFAQLKLDTEPSEPTLDSEPATCSSSGLGNEETRKEELERCRKMDRATDIASFLDSELSRNALDRPVAIEIESLGPTNDDEMGHPILNDTRLDASLPSTYTRDIEIEEIVRDRTRPRLSDAAEERPLAIARNHFLTQYRYVLQDVVPSRVWASLEQAHLFTDYAPLIKQVAEADDAQAVALVQQAQERRGRQTRNSALSSYIRTLDLSEEGSQGLAEICFRDLDF